MECLIQLKVLLLWDSINRWVLRFKSSKGFGLFGDFFFSIILLS
jgi:hypothetical protein